MSDLPVRADAAGERLARRLASSQTRRGFLGRLGAGVTALVGGRMAAAAVQPEAAEAFHFCGHIFTTGSCPSPLGLPRIDSKGLPVRPKDGRPIDNIGRLVDGHGYAVNEAGKRIVGPTGQPVPKAPRTRLCQDWVREVYLPRLVPQIDGGWYRCCGGTIRKLVDCCSTSKKRINGDASLVGYCYSGRRVFCVMYFQTRNPC
jgi:hypothetical protein